MHLFKKCLPPVLSYSYGCPVHPLYAQCYPVHPLYGHQALFAQQAVRVTQQVAPLEYRPTPQARG